MSAPGELFPPLPEAVEWLAIGVLTVWILASAAYAAGWRARALRPLIAQFRVLATWRVFGAKGSPGLGRLELDQRVRSGSGETEWVTVDDARWSWHAFLCMPDRRIGNRLFHLIREMAEDLKSVGGGPRSQPGAAQVVARYLGRTAPLRPGEVRELRLIIRHLPGPAASQILHTFRVGPDGNLHG